MSVRKTPLLLMLALSLMSLFWPHVVGQPTVLSYLFELILTLTLFLMLFTWFSGLTSEVAGQKTLSTYLVEALYVLNFMGLAFWRIYRTFTLVPTSFSYLSPSLLDATLGLIGFGGLMGYLALRKQEGTRPVDVTSRHLLSLMAYVFLIFSGGLATEVVLGLSLDWLYLLLIYGLTIYVILALGSNLLIALIRRNLLGDINYTLLPPSFKVPVLLEIANVSPKSRYTLGYLFHIAPALVLTFSGLLWISTIPFVVQPYQQGAVYRFGELTPQSIVGSGLHVKWPWPMDQVAIHDVHRLQTAQVGFESAEGLDNIWTLAHSGAEHLLLLGYGNELVALNVVLAYTIGDLYTYLTRHQDPTALLTAAAYDYLLHRTATTTLDALLREDRSSLSASLFSALTTFSQAQGLGLTLADVIIEGIHPPIEVAAIYQRVVTASLEGETLATTASGRATQTLIEAEQARQTAILSARARQFTLLGEALHQQSLFHAALEAYTYDPHSFNVVRQRETFERLFSERPLYVFSEGLAPYLAQFIIGHPTQRSDDDE